MSLGGKRMTGRSTLGSILVRWGGLAAALAGVLFATWGYVHRDNAPPYWDVVAAALAFAVPLLFFWGIVGLCARCGRLVGWLGAMGFTIGFVGSAWGVVRSVLPMSSWYDYVAEQGWSPPLLDWLPTLFVGIAFVGVAAIRARVVRELGILLLMMAVFGWAYHLTDFPDDFGMLRSTHVVFGVLFSLSWMALGYALWSEVGRSALKNR